MPAPPRSIQIRTDAVSLWGHVIEGFQATNQHLHRTIAQEYSLSAAEAEALLRLSRTPGQRLPMAELAGQVAFSAGGFTKVADRLARRDLVQRTPCAEDRRVVFLELTVEGEATAGRLRGRVTEIVQDAYVDVLGTKRAVMVATAMAELAEARREAFAG
jgi:DNA-binding MarR family transcriptional regulator